MLLAMLCATTRAQFHLFDFAEIEAGSKLLSRYRDSLTFTRQQDFVSVYRVEFNVNPTCEKSYRITSVDRLTELRSKPYNYFFSRYNRYFIFYDPDSIHHHRVEVVDETLREKLKHFVIDDASGNWFICNKDMGCEFNGCAKNTLYLAYPPGSRYILRPPSFEEGQQAPMRSPRRKRKR